MRLVRNHEVEIRRREEAAVLVVELEGLDGADDDLRAAPIVAALLVDDRPEVGREQRREYLPRLLLQLESIHQEENSLCIAGAQE